MPASSSRTPFIGRQQELAALSAHLAAASQGRGGVVLVSGEPGIGKTRLLGELTTQATAAGWLVLTGRAYDSEGMPPYLPIVAALREYVRACPLDQLQGRIGSGAAELALLVPELHEWLPDLPPGPPLYAEYARYRLFEGVADFLLGIARSSTAGLLFVLDDLHWADKPTLLLLVHLARRLIDAPLLVVGAFRTTELPRTAPLAEVLAEFRRERLAERLALAALPPGDATALIAALTMVPPASELAAAIYRQTDGNAFFLEELVRQLHAEGRDFGEPSPTIADWNLPEGVREVVGRRLSRLSPTASGLLQTVAVLGDGPIAVLAAATGLDWAVLTEVLEQTVGAGMLREETGAYAFTHALIRQTVLDELSLPRRQQLHHRVALAIEQVFLAASDEVVSELATHYRLAGALGDPGKTVRYARQAAEAAHKTFAWEAASEHWQAALAALAADDAEQRGALLLALGEAQSRVGDLVGAKATFQQAAEMARTAELPEVLAEAALGHSGYPGTGMVAHALLEEALRLLPANDSVLRVRLLSRVAQSLQTTISRQERRRALLDEALAMARRLGDPAALLVASMAWLVPQPASPEWRPMVRDLLQLADAAGDRQWTALGFLWRQQLLIRLGDRAEAQRSFAVDQALAGKLRDPVYQYNVALIDAMWALLEGRFADADGLIADGLDRGTRTNHPGAPFWYGLQRYVMLCGQARYAELLAQEETNLVARAENTPLQQHWRARLAYLYAQVGRMRDARTELDRLSTNDFGDIHGPAGYNWLLCLALLPEVCVALGDRRRAEALYGYLATYAGHCLVIGPNTAVCFGAADRYLGMLAALLGRWEDALRHYAVAVDVNDRLGARPYLAHCLREQALALRSAGGRDAEGRAQELLARSLALYEELGLEQAAGATRARLTQPSAHSTGRPAYPDRLSEREVEVLRLVAAGKSNQEIADSLVISLRTAAFHVANILGKTGTANRTEAAAYAYRHHLVADPL